ncbi:hypothetical protein GCM10018779_66750 [Streptomyces griseocarneus]|nr:hypothetical protein GCM10018779_66750 [Streptomyces griseocarneus]
MQVNDVTNPEATRRILCYAKDIGVADIKRLEAFLANRTERLARAERGSDERQLARSIRTATVHLVTALEHALACSGRDDEAQLMLQLDVKVSWNALWALVSPWQWHAESDLERWRPVKHWEARQGGENENLLSDATSNNRYRDASEDNDSGL